MNTTSKILLFLILLSSSATLAATDVDADISINVISETPRTLTSVIEFSRPTLRAAEINGSARLWVEMKEATPDFDADGPALPAYLRLISVPDGHSVRVHVRQSNSFDISVEPVMPRDKMNLRGLREVAPLPLVEVGEAGWMRWLRVAPVVFRPARYNAEENRIECIERMEVEFEFIPDVPSLSNTPDPDRYWSLAFDELFGALLLNPGSLPSFIMPGGNIVNRGSYIIITDSALARTTDEFAEWKRRKGYNVVVNPMYYNGISPDEIKAYIQDAYDNWDRPPEVVVLLGDENMPGIRLPSFRIRHPNYRKYPNENDVTDIPYSLLTSDDYYPDLLIGRISVNSSEQPIDPLKYFARVLAHEQRAHTFPAAAFHRATLYAGNFSDENVPVLSPVETCEWLGIRLRERGWDVEDFYNRGGENDPLNPIPIIESINRGVNIVAYRGWADANGTHVPQLYRGNLDRFSNGPLLPMFTFFVCNVGDFGNSYVNPCFGETYILGGSHRRPTGALAFYGPSDLHTNTRFNNPMLGGWYSGLLFNGIRNVFMLSLRGKWEVWRANPDFRHRGGPDNYAEFYYYVYHILGDPDLSYYLDAPEQLRVEHSNHFTVGQTFERFVVRRSDGSPMRGALLTLRKGDDMNMSLLTDADGIAIVPLHLTTPDSLQITAIGHEASPYMATLPVGIADRMIGLESVTIRNAQNGNTLSTGEPIDLLLTLKNLGTQPISGISARLNPSEDIYQVINGATTFGNLDAGESATGNTALRVQINPNTWIGTQAIFELTIEDNAGNSWLALFRIPVAGPQLYYSGHSFDAPLIAGQTRNMVVSLTNKGSQPLGAITGRIHTHDESIIIEDETALFGNVPIGATVNCSENPFRITARERTMPGRLVLMRLELFDAQERKVGMIYFNITVGVRNRTDPIGPDGYGYYAYDNTDVDYDQSPIYEWIELDPDFGGSGAVLHPLSDDSTFGMRLPFTFRFYGADYDSVFICSNGWVSFAVRKINSEFDFNNQPIPNPLGPHTMIAPFWEDLVGQMDGRNRSRIKVFERFDREAGRFVIEWSRAVARSGNNIDCGETFQLILYDPQIHSTLTGDGVFTFQYNEVVFADQSIDYSFASVGIQDYNHLRGMELAYAARYQPGCDSIVAGRAIKFTTNPPDNYLRANENRHSLPGILILDEPYPNPFNAATLITYALPQTGRIRLVASDLSGRQVEVIQDEVLTAGQHRTMWDAGHLSSGIYMIRMEAGNYRTTVKAIILR